jgi:hypothetical protein
VYTKAKDGEEGIKITVESEKSNNRSHAMRSPAI